MPGGIGGAYMKKRRSWNHCLFSLQNHCTHKRRNAVVAGSEGKNVVWSGQRSRVTEMCDKSMNPWKPRVVRCIANELSLSLSARCNT